MSTRERSRYRRPALTTILASNARAWRSCPEEDAFALIARKAGKVRHSAENGVQYHGSIDAVHLRAGGKNKQTRLAIIAALGTPRLSEAERECHRRIEVALTFAGGSPTIARSVASRPPRPQFFIRNRHFSMKGIA